MSDCTLRSAAMENRLDPEGQAVFAQHRLTCDDCQAAMTQWETSRSLLIQFVDDRSPVPSGPAQARLLNAVSQNTGPRRLRRLVPVAAAGAALGVALFIFSFFSPSPQPQPSSPSIAYEVVYPVVSNPRRSVPAGGTLIGTGKGEVFRFGTTSLGLAQRAVLQVEAVSEKENRFSLVEGTVAMALPPAEKRERLFVEAGDVTVAVKGTIFWVERQRESVIVGVLRGEVGVEIAGGKETRVSAGRALTVKDRQSTIGAVSESDEQRVRALLAMAQSSNVSVHPVDAVVQADNPAQDKTGGARSRLNKNGHTAKPLPELSEIEQLIIAGNYTGARAAIDQRLKADRLDAPALDLLATCHRKQGAYKDAATVYEQLTTLGGPVAQNRARYRLGVLYQEQLGNHAAAVTQLEQYLRFPASTRPNTPEARLRLATSYQKLGRADDYRRMLETIIAQHPGTREAQDAARRLQAGR